MAQSTDGFKLQTGYWEMMELWVVGPLWTTGVCLKGGFQPQNPFSSRQLYEATAALYSALPLRC